MDGFNTTYASEDNGYYWPTAANNLQPFQYSQPQSMPYVEANQLDHSQYGTRQDEQHLQSTSYYYSYETLCQSTYPTPPQSSGGIHTTPVVYKGSKDERAESQTFYPPESPPEDIAPMSFSFNAPLLTYAPLKPARTSDIQSMATSYPPAPTPSHPLMTLPTLLEPPPMTAPDRTERKFSAPSRPSDLQDGTPDLPQVFANSPQQLFPTPSQVLAEMSSHGYAASADEIRASSATPTSATEGARRGETSRQARFRKIATSIGFQPTDPDTISSHEKRRQWLECMEEYILFLHEQLRLVDTEPLKLQRVDKYAGMNSRSVRTLLVHEQNMLKKRQEEALVEERTFIDLRRELVETEERLIAAGLHLPPYPGEEEPTNSAFL